MHRYNRCPRTTLKEISQRDPTKEISARLDVNPNRSDTNHGHAQFIYTSPRALGISANLEKHSDSWGTHFYASVSIPAAFTAPI